MSRFLEGRTLLNVLGLPRQKSWNAIEIVRKNTIPGDKSALMPGGIRIGPPALTSRGFVEADFEKVVDFFDRAVNIAVKLKNTEEGKKLKGFKEMCAVGPSVDPELEASRNDVMDFACSFPTVGFDEDEIESKVATM